MKIKNTVLIMIMILAVSCAGAYAQAQLEWRSLGGGASVTQLVAGETYELYAVGLGGGLDGWIVDFSTGTAGFSAVAEADRSSSSVAGVWDNSDIPVSGGESFFDVSVPDQLIVDFMHHTNTGPSINVTDNSQFLCKVTASSASVGLLRTNGPKTRGIGGTELVGSEIQVVGGTGDLNYDGFVNFEDFTMLAKRWLDIGCVYPDNCGRADINGSSNVDMKDMEQMAGHWLE